MIRASQAPAPSAPEPDPATAASVANAGSPGPQAGTGGDVRLGSLLSWLLGLAERHGLELDTIRPASNDASFRRYFRIDTRDAGRSLIAMDAPPPQEDCRPFVHAASVLRDAGLRVPAVHEADLERGFLLLGDLGTRTLLDRLGEKPGDSEIDRLYRAAGQLLVTMQAASRPGLFPDYDRALLERELMLYPDWYLARHRRLEASDEDRNTLHGAFELLLANNLAQPRVHVHRDYHSRNLMVDDAVHEHGLGLIDFQDAVYGPITYDLVSLLRDAYVAWPEERQLDWAVRWWESARARSLPVAADFGDFWRDFEWMGLQRHLKVLGIFARLYYRDGKDRYLADMPRVLAAAQAVARRYRDLAPLARLLDRVEAGADERGGQAGHRR